MVNSFANLASQLDRLNLRIKHDMEQAEAKVAEMNRLIKSLGKSGLLNRVAFLGKGNRSMFYDKESGEECASMVVPALLVPGGFGVCIWDSQKACALENEPGGLIGDARKRFTPFNRCTAENRAFLFPFIEPLLSELVDIAKVAASRAAAGKVVTAREYFRKRQKVSVHRVVDRKDAY